MFNFPDKAIKLLKELHADKILTSCSYANYLSEYSRGLLTIKEYKPALAAITLAFQADSTNEQTLLYLPFVYLCNNQYEKAQRLIRRWENKPWTSHIYFNVFGEAYRYTIPQLEQFGLDKVTISKIEQLLDKYPFIYLP